MRVGIVIPGYNEAQKIGGVLSDLASLAREKVGKSFELIVVDDGSTDDTLKAARKHAKNLPTSMRLHALRHRTNLGKGGAASTGCEAARRIGVDVIVLMDADGQHRAQDVAKLIQAHAEFDGEALIIGSRERSRNMPAMMRFGNGVLSGMSRTLFNLRVKDTQSGLRAFPASIYPKLKWASNQYAMETEMLIMAQASRVPILEIPIETIYHDNHKGTTPLDGLKIARTLLEWRLLKSPSRHLAVVEDSLSDSLIA